MIFRNFITRRQRMKSDAKGRSRRNKVRVRFTRATRPRLRKIQVVEGYGPIDRAAFDPSPQDWDDFDEILGNFGDWGDH